MTTEPRDSPAAVRPRRRSDRQADLFQETVGIGILAGHQEAAAA